MRIRETCSCGASVEIVLDSPTVAREAVDHWRDSHRHEVRGAAPVGGECEHREHHLVGERFLCADCWAVVDCSVCGPSLSAPVAAQDGQQAAEPGCEHMHHDWDADGWVCSDCGAPADCADCGPPPGAWWHHTPNTDATAWWHHTPNTDASAKEV